MTSHLRLRRCSARGVFALACALTLASFGGSSSAEAGGAAAARAAPGLEAKSSGLMLLAKNDDRDGRNRNRGGHGNNGNKNWSKNDKGWGGDGNNNWNKKNGKKYGKGWGDHGHGGKGNWNRGYVKEWNRRPHYGEFFGGIILGSLLAANGIGVVPPYPPAPGLCWYWADPFMYRGYWDYCD